MGQKLTKRGIEGLTYAGDGTSADIRWDTELKGFGVRVFPSGECSFVLRYTLPTGRKRTVTLGRFGELTVEKARQQALALKLAARQGEDPVETRKAARHAITVAELAERYMAEHAAPKKKPRSVAEDRRLLRLHVLPALGTRPVRDVSRSDVQQLHHRMRETPGAANRTLALLSTMMGLAEKWGLRPDGSNPTRHVTKFRELARERYLSAEEYQRLGAVLAEASTTRTESPFVLGALQVLLLTGARLSEILTLQWAWIDQERGALRLPDSKTGAKVIPLSIEALAVLRALPRVEGNPYVFVGERAGRHLVNIQKPWRRIRAKAGLGDVRIHDLRHSFASVAAADQLSLHMIGKMLGHRQAATTARYAHLHEAAVHEAASRTAGHIAGALRGPKSA